MKVSKRLGTSHVTKYGSITSNGRNIACLNWHDGIYARGFMEADPVEACHVRALGLSMRLVLIESYGLVHLVLGSWGPN